MNKEEKARRYDEALAHAREIHRNENEKRRDMEWLFPELAESEDERIRKAIICGMNVLKEQKKETFAAVPINDCLAWLEKQKPMKQSSEDERIRKELISFLETCQDTHLVGNRNRDMWIAWLEKQGTPAKLSEEEQNKFAKCVLSGCAISFINYLDAHAFNGKMCVSNGECEDIENAFQNAMWDRLHRYYRKFIEKQGEEKPTDKIEPKFKVGDWVVQGCNILKIRCVGDEYYCFETVGGYVDDMLVSEIDSLYHLWNIQDAKKGDVLADDNGFVMIVAESRDSKWGYRLSRHCAINSKNSFCSLNLHTKIDGLHPATKEQRDLLFAKMKEAGYEWDAENKELKKIEQNPVWSEEDEIGNYSKVARKCVDFEVKAELLEKEGE